MERDYKYEPDLFCEGCGALGGYDIMGDILCEYCLSSLSDPDLPADHEPVYATLHFYYDDQDSMERFRVCNQAEDVKNALHDYARWLHDKIKYGGDEDGHPQLTEAWNVWFEVFRGHGLPVPGWDD